MSLLTPCNEILNGCTSRAGKRVQISLPTPDGHMVLYFHLQSVNIEFFQWFALSLSFLPFTSGRDLSPIYRKKNLLEVKMKDALLPVI